MPFYTREEIDQMPYYWSMHMCHPKPMPQLTTEYVIRSPYSSHPDAVRTVEMLPPISRINTPY